ncbi:MAG: hypothetical protein FJ012_03070 [Chloroflexi bacterium]|nr:hypothetical protein [Chloroflexota bacterium]
MTNHDSSPLYRIQAGCSFWYTDSGGEKKVLIVKDNGMTPDIWGSGGRPLAVRTLGAGMNIII